MDAVLSSALREATYGWLDRLEIVVAGADAASLAALAQTELVRMVAAWRALLAEHEPDQDGRCRRCSGWRHRRACPCSVWVAAHRYLVMTEAPAPGCGAACDEQRPAAVVVGR
jgi:hypothetical protein